MDTNVSVDWDLMLEVWALAASLPCWESWYCTTGRDGRRYSVRSDANR